MTVHKSECHCGAIKFELHLPNGLEGMRRCNCSICSKRGTIAATVRLENLLVIAGEESLTLYQFGSYKAKHYFCSICGIYTHHQRYSDPNTYGVNIGCIEGFDPYNQKNVEITNGSNI